MRGNILFWSASGSFSRFNAFLNLSPAGLSRFPVPLRLRRFHIRSGVLVGAFAGKNPGKTRKILDTTWCACYFHFNSIE